MYPGSPQNPPTLVSMTTTIKVPAKKRNRFGEGAVGLVCPWEEYFMWTGSKYWAWRKLAYYIWAGTRYDRFNWRRSRTATLKAVRSGHQEGELHVRQGWESLSIDICVQNTRREGNVCCKALPTERQYRHVDKFGGRAIGRGHRKLGAAESHSTCTATGQAETRRPTSSSRRVRIVGGPRR
jgi:hypothetical protein